MTVQIITPLLQKLGFPVLLDVVQRALGQVPHPAATKASETMQDVVKNIQNGGISPAQIEAAQKYALAELAQEGETLKQINETMRIEAASNDAYVRRMRPTFGYILAISWGAQMLALAYIILWRTDQASLVIESMQSLGFTWGVGLSVLGVYVYKRSEEKNTSPKQSDSAGKR